MVSNWNSANINILCSIEYAIKPKNVFWSKHYLPYLVFGTPSYNILYN